MPKTKSFFLEQTEASRLKAGIVSKYFSAWANVIASQGRPRIGYLDLYSGPGRYDDGNPSTPLFIIENTVNHKNQKVRETIRLTFNDSDPQNVEKLKSEIEKFPGIEKIKISPKTNNIKISDEIVKVFEGIKAVPTLSFIDPWGYKGLSLKLVRALVKDWGCDSIFFFNYRRINPGIENEVLEKPISKIFTKEVLLELREKVLGKDPFEREKIILQAVKEVFNGWGMDYVLPFPFKSESGNRTTHYLIFVTKNILGYNIMKEIMAKSSSSHIQNVPSFEYNPAAAKEKQISMFEKPLDKLEKMLLYEFAGSKLTMEQVYERHNVGKCYIRKNYKEALLNLENQGKIRTNRAQSKCRKGAFPNKMLVTFPKKKRLIK